MQLLITTETLYITAYDFEQAFDSLWLQDCILSLHALGVPEYILKLIYNLNREAEITVKTPYGLTHTLHSVAPLNDNNRETEKAAYDTVQRVEE